MTNKPDRLVNHDGGSLCQHPQENSFHTAPTSQRRQWAWDRWVPIRLLFLFSVILVISGWSPWSLLKPSYPPGSSVTHDIDVMTIHDPWNPWAEKDAIELAREFASLIVSIKETSPVVEKVRLEGLLLRPYRVNMNLISCTISATITYNISVNASPGTHWFKVTFHGVNGERIGDVKDILVIVAPD